MYLTSIVTTATNIVHAVSVSPSVITTEAGNVTDFAYINSRFIFTSLLSWSPSRYLPSMNKGPVHYSGSVLCFLLPIKHNKSKVPIFLSCKSYVIHQSISLACHTLQAKVGNHRSIAFLKKNLEEIAINYVLPMAA